MRDIKEIPYSLIAEQAVVACCVWDATSVPLVFEICRVADFIDSDMAAFMTAIKDVWEEEAAIDRITVEQKLHDTGLFTEQRIAVWEGIVNGNKLTCVPTAANVEYYARIVQAKRYERELVEAIEKLSRDLYDKTLNVREKKELFDQAVLSLTVDGESENQSLAAIAKRLWNSLHTTEQESICVQTGYESIDEQIGGFAPGEIAIIAGRPSDGKSTMLLEMALGISLHRPVLLLSMEMSQESLAYRVLANLSRISILNIKNGDLNAAQEEKLLAAYQQISRYKLYIDETPMLSPASAAAKVLRAKAVYGIGCVMVDYMQLMHIPKWRSDNRVTEITRISSELRAIAKRARVPLIVASQMSRAIESRTDGEPRLSDLRESGAIEQDADYVFFLYPYKYKYEAGSKYKAYVPGANDPREHCCKLAKCRQGPRDIHLTFHWEPAYYTFKTAPSQCEDIPF